MSRLRKWSIIAITGMIISCGQQENNTTTDNKADSASNSADAVVTTAREAFVYGLPLVILDLTRRQTTTDSSSRMYSPMNNFQHSSEFPDAKFRSVVRPNADTYYSTAFLDLQKEPIVLTVPDTKGRYYMMPMLDAYTNVFASPGTRTTGNKKGNFLISGPQWSGDVPSGMNHIKSPTNSVWIIGRTQVNSKEDGANVVAPLQKQYKLTPLSAVGKVVAPSQPASDPDLPKGDPNSIVRTMKVEDYFNYMNELLAKNPPPADDKAAIDRFATIGVGAGKKFELSAIPENARSNVENVPKDVFSAMANQLNSPRNLKNGWDVGRDVIGIYGTHYPERAAISFFGLGANLREDAIYPSALVDAEGNPFNGNNQYILRFEKGKLPPSNAFWSLTMYDPEGFFIENPINRYAIGDRSNLKTNSDGSIDIYIQKENPGGTKSSNWLPAPAGNFNLLMRVYWPKEEMLDGSWTPPAVQKVK